ncbi:uncharacterized protein LOC106157010 [Lingula anatina]|uniref:Uncharacterized protein LOC106157010 n=1 Tax=Lingula anatina TaxID=7574 RepID=A0A1S3HPE7_LINAN|nr:uncharacterized protein LOC106157010 [Lingula anatina]|eukprot:XP_013387928.1 uncharacterized protein LOC106157010 [Lingula anatina]
MKIEGLLSFSTLVQMHSYMLAVLVLSLGGTMTSSQLMQENHSRTSSVDYELHLSCTQVGVLDSTLIFYADLVNLHHSPEKEPTYFQYIWTDGADKTVHPIQRRKRFSFYRDYFGNPDVIPGTYNMTVQVYKPRKVGTNDTLIAQNYTSFTITEFLNVNVSISQRVKSKLNNGTTFATRTNVTFYAKALDNFTNPEILNTSYFYHWNPEVSIYKDKDKGKNNNFTYIFTSTGDQHMTLNTTIVMMLNDTNSTQMVKTKLTNRSLVLKDAVGNLDLKLDTILLTEQKLSGKIKCTGSVPLNITICAHKGDDNNTCYQASNLDKCKLDVSQLNIVFHQGGKYMMNFTVSNEVSVTNGNYTLQVNAPDYEPVNQFVPILFALMVIFIIAAAIGYTVYSRRKLMVPIDPEVASFEFQSVEEDKPSLFQRFKSTDFGKFLFASYRAGEKRGQANYASFTLRYGSLKDEYA